MLFLILGLVLVCWIFQIISVFSFLTNPNPPAYTNITQNHLLFYVLVPVVPVVVDFVKNLKSK